MIVASSIDEDAAAPEELPQLVQNMHAPDSLDHCEYGLDLPTQSHRVAPEDRNAEAAFTVYETNDPLLESWPFLLIVRTRHVFTAFPRAVFLADGE
jgi:hypothetical protein